MNLWWSDKALIGCSGVMIGYCGCIGLPQTDGQLWVYEGLNPPGQRFHAADVNHDGEVNGLDQGAWLTLFNAKDPRVDLNFDGEVTPSDFGVWLNQFNKANR